MTTPADDLVSDILASNRFRQAYQRLTTAELQTQLLAVAGETVDLRDWSYLLSCASVLGQGGDEVANSAALRVLQDALTMAPSETQRAAAIALLERSGNDPAVRLAGERDLRGAANLGSYPGPLCLEIIRNQLELSVLAGRDAYRVSRFQRDFWSAAQSSSWVSVSAPTSAGKSFIVRSWFLELIADAERTGSDLRLFAVVPTRALIEEVSREFRAALPKDVVIQTLPTAAGSATAATPSLSPVREVYVLTQERLHLLQQRQPDLSGSLLFVDEAHKLGDGSRGVLLRQVIDESLRRNPGTQVVFASPLALDPEVLLQDLPEDVAAEVVASVKPTVVQNLLYANQMRGTRLQWTLEVRSLAETIPIGVFALPARPTTDGKRLPLVAVALGDRASANVVYANGQAEAEKMARVIYDAVGERPDLAHDEDIAVLREAIRRTIHPRYDLEAVLSRGIAFHYGNMPQLLRSEIERLFKGGKIQYLVCTSTLLEGVNLPCKNLFIRGPRRGRSTPMEAADFWNLAGRAGRWGMEFSGNIVCVDTEVVGRWASVPTERVRQRLKQTVQSVLANPELLINYILADEPDDEVSPDAEAVVSFLSARVASGLSLTDIPALGLSADAAFRMTSALETMLSRVELPASLLERHTGIDPRRIEALRKRLQNSVRLVVPLPPEQEGSAASFAECFGILAEVMQADFGNQRRQNQLGVLVVRWMEGQPLRLIIENRIQYLASQPKPPPVSRTIRDVMGDVEKYARFVAPRYLACYIDVLRLQMAQSGNVEAASELLRDIDVLLEMGVSTTTQLSLLALGLSRTSAVEIFKYIVRDDLDEVGCLSWLRSNDIARLDLPELVRREVLELLHHRGGS